jgi:hypothetical protein
LSEHLQILLPIGFVNVGGALIVSSAEEKNLLACISNLALSSAATETNDLHFQTSIEVQIKKTGALNSPSVKITSDPGATPVFLTEENLALIYPWTYDEVTKRCNARYSNFKASQKYHDLRKQLADDTKLYRLRLLDPSNPKGIKKPFYSTNVLAFFDKHYTQK